jgi:hypothetical protein
MRRILMIGALVCAASPGLAHKIRVDFDHGIHFSRYKTTDGWIRQVRHRRESYSRMS